MDFDTAVSPWPRIAMFRPFNTLRIVDWPCASPRIHANPTVDHVRPELHRVLEKGS